MTPFHEIKTVPPVKAIGMRGDLSLWGIDTAFGRLYDKAMEGRLMFRQPALGVDEEAAGQREGPRPVKQNVARDLELIEQCRRG